MTFPKQLISILNSGRCVAIVGSGPSSEMGYPTWHKLAGECIVAAKRLVPSLDDTLFARLMAAKDYPRVFKYVQQALGRDDLLRLVATHLSSDHSPGKAYGILAKWPFRFYMTTNWDSEIQAHLERLGQHFTEIGNSHAEITQITDDTTRQIVKLHGMLSKSDGVVIAEDDYQSFKVSDARKYFRDTLRAILRTLPAVIIGHSLSDPDLQTILETAKTIAPSHRPIYMIVADPRREDVHSFLGRYNIHLIGYVSDSTHSHFLRLLSTIDKFVVPRTDTVIRPVDLLPQEEIEVATSLLVFNSLNKSIDDVHLLDRLVYPQILQNLRAKTSPAHKGDICASLVPDALRTLPAIVSRLDAGLERLRNEQYVTGDDTQGWSLTTAGVDYVEKTLATQHFEDDQVYGALVGRLKSVGVGEADCTKAAHSLRSAVLSVFRRRGIAAASLVFRNQQFEPVDMAELFESVSSSIRWSESYELREEFINFSVRLFSKPTEQERRYLARVSQGLFAVHVFGVDPQSVAPRIQVFRNTTWFLDSNVLIHLLAKGSALDEMSTTICDKCRILGIRLFASKGVVSEALNSLNWASDMCSSLQPQEEMQFILNVYNEDGYRHNPYIDGFVALHQKLSFRRFSAYRSHLEITNYASVEAILEKQGITIVGVDRLPKDNLRRNSFTVYKHKILLERERRRTSSGDFQAAVEAEVLCLILAERDTEVAGALGLAKAYFVSTSRLIDHVFGREHGTITWFPDVFFRHLSLISPSTKDAESLIESLGTELADLGVTLVDEESYRIFFDPLISSSRLSFERERDGFVKAIGDEIHATAEELQREFEATPDTGKPLFIAQLEWRATAKTTSHLERELVVAAQQRKDLADKLTATEQEWEKKQKETVRHYENRIRNLSDPVRRRKGERKKRNKRKRRKSR